MRIPALTALSAGLIVTLGIGGAADGAAAKPADPKVGISTPRSTVEGDRFAVTVRVGAARRAQRVTLLEQTEDLWGAVTWTPVRAVPVKGRSKVAMRTLADDRDRYRLRAQVRYADGRVVTSEPTSVRVWHWYALSGFDAYYSTGGVSNHEYSSFTMNGDTWRGWYTYSGQPMWESRYTPGRNCRAFRGTAGVRDASADGSSGSITLIADETEIVWESPELTPGMVAPFEIELDRPYRFAIQARDTSVEPAYAAPAIGAPEFLCDFG